MIIAILLGYYFYEKAKENYLLLRQMGENENRRVIYNINSDQTEEKNIVKKYLYQADSDYKNKYDDDTDYDTSHQRRAKGQNRDDGEDH
jgi:hypothetical protein